MSDDGCFLVSLHFIGLCAGLCLDHVPPNLCGLICGACIDVCAGVCQDVASLRHSCTAEKPRRCSCCRRSHADDDDEQGEREPLIKGQKAPVNGVEMPPQPPMEVKAQKS
ncbi:hypothetical protein DFH09DRAFT_435808 [Mycena vulgaris]|nr:hypothetical protein DFH09DRAFT_435808 [Mycena vulgaris]